MQMSRRPVSLQNRSGAYLVISGIDQDLVKDLEETRNIADVLLRHPLGLPVKDPELSLKVFHRTDVRIGSFQDVLELRQLPIRIRETINTLGIMFSAGIGGLTF